MDLISLKVIKNLLKKYSRRPIKGLGQNFLINKDALKKIIEAADLRIEDTVLEIGPGIGTLTQELAKKAKRVVAVEKDKKMVEILKETLKNYRNIKIIQGDILKIRISELGIRNFKIIANLPYYITSPVIRKFLENTKNRPLQMVLMVQKEVAQRVCAKPPDMNLLTTSVQFYAEPKIISYVSKKSFWPSPKVDSAILRIAPLINANRKQINTDLFFRIVKAGFSQPRKQLINNLSKGLKIDKEKVIAWLQKNNINPSQRAETLSVENWINFTNTFKNYVV